MQWGREKGLIQPSFQIQKNEKEKIKDNPNKYNVCYFANFWTKSLKFLLFLLRMY